MEPGRSFRIGRDERAEDAGRSLDLQLQPLPMQRPEDLSDAFATATKHGVGAVVVSERRSPHSRATNRRARQPAHACQRFRPEEAPRGRRDPQLRRQFSRNVRRVAGILDRIHKGAKPSDIPVERLTKFDLVVSDKAAMALGLALPRLFLVRADEVIPIADDAPSSTSRQIRKGIMARARGFEDANERWLRRMREGRPKMTQISLTLRRAISAKSSTAWYAMIIPALDAANPTGCDRTWTRSFSRWW